MTDASSKTGGKANGAEPLATTVSSRSTVSRAAITPALALARHVEWLDFALAAARSEETWRAARLKKATKKTLDKRTSRLAEVRDEIAELAALIDAIRGLKPSGSSRPAPGTAKPRAAGAAKPRATGARKRTAAATSTVRISVDGGCFDDGHASNDRAEALDHDTASRVQAGGDEEARRVQARRDHEEAGRDHEDPPVTTTRRTGGRSPS